MLSEQDEEEQYLMKEHISQSTYTVALTFLCVITNFDQVLLSSEKQW